MSLHDIHKSINNKTKFNSDIERLIAFEIYLSGLLAQALKLQFNVDYSLAELLIRNDSYYSFLSANSSWFWGVFLQEIDDNCKADMMLIQYKLRPIGSVYYYDSLLGNQDGCLTFETLHLGKPKVYYIKIKSFDRDASYEFLKSINLDLSEFISLSDTDLALLCLKKLIKPLKGNKGVFKMLYRDLSMSKDLYFLMISRSILQFNFSLDSQEGKNPILLQNLDKMDHFDKCFVERSVVLSNILEFSKSMNFISSYKDFRKKMLQMIILLIKNGKIVQEVKRRAGFDTIQTVVFWRFRLLYASSLLEKIEVRALLYKPRIYNQFSFGYSFYSFDTLIKKSSHQEVMNKIDLAPIESLVSTRYKLGVSLEDFNAIIRFFNLNVDFSDKLIDDLYHSLKEEMLMLLSDINRCGFGSHSDYYSYSKSGKRSYKEYNITKAELSKVMSSYTSLINLSSFYKLYKLFGDSWFYFPMFKDFRGRNYSYCPSHPVFNRITRNFLVFDSLLEIGSLESSLYYRSVLLAFSEAVESFDYISHTFLSLKSTKFKLDHFLYFAGVLLIEMFKLHKSDYLSHTGLSLASIIDLGLKIWSGSKLAGGKCFDKIDDYIYFNKICCSLEALFSQGDLLNITIIRDSVASFIQHWSYLLHAKDGDVLRLLNLSGVKLFDFYYFVMGEVRLLIIKEDPDLLELYDKFITRSVVKKPVMTSNYNVTLNRSWDYFWGEIEGRVMETTNIPMGDDVRDKFIRIHKVLYNYSNKGAFSSLFVLNKDDYLSSLNHTFLHGDYSFSYLYKKEGLSRQEKITKSGVSIRITTKSRTVEDDFLRSNRALNANLLHTQDALLADYLFPKVKCFSIHDSFGCSIYDTHLLMDSTNRYFEERLGREAVKEYSPFVLF